MSLNWKNLLLTWGILILALFWLPGAWMPYQDGKWLAIYGITFFSLFLHAFRRDFLIPKFSKIEGIWLSTLFFGLIFSLFWFHGWDAEFSLLDRFSFFLLFWFFWWSFREGLKWEAFFYPLFFSIIFVSGYGIWQSYSVGFPGSMPYYLLGSFFGHSNNAAQFVGLAIFLLWISAGKNRNLALVATLLGVAYLYLSRGRSALFAFVIASVFAFVLAEKKSIQKFWKPAILAFTAAIILIAGIQFRKGFSLQEIFTGSIFGEKASMVTYREDVWKQTVKMIQSRPLGVGVDRYAFRFVPFHKDGTTVSTDHMALAPHNEILRYLAEDGIPLACFIFLTVFFFFRKWVKSTDESRKRFYPFFLFLGIEGLFQFPWQNPLPTYFTAVVFGFMASEFQSETKKEFRFPVFALLALLFLFPLSKVFFSRIWENSKQENFAKISCSLVPANWRSCLNYSRILLSMNKLPDARVVVQNELRRDSANFVATRHLAVIAFRQGRHLEGCFHSWVYDYTYGGKSDIHESYVKNCPQKYRDYFDRKKPNRYFHR
jgi:O-antigen ligase